MRSIIRLALALVALLAFAAAPAAAAGPEAAVTTGDGLPPGIAPLPPELLAEVTELVEAAVERRGLPLRRPLVAGVLAAGEAERQIAAMIDEEIPPAELAAAERALRRFGLLPPAAGGDDLRGALLGVLVEQVAGYYDPTRDYLALATGVTAELGAELPAEAAGQMLAGLWVHEIVHALQDQHYDLDELTAGPFVSDRGLARSALVEGDATVAMTGYLLGADVTALPELAGAMAAMADDVDGLAAGAGSMPGTEALAAAPAYLRETLLFPYLRGMVFVLAVHEAGGEELLEHAFRTDPPASTEQILHPEKWIERSDPPVELDLEGLAAPAPGWERALVGSLGELGVRIALEERLGEGEREAIAAAAAGWGGDAFVLYRAGADGELLGWVTEWDTPAEADEFLRLASQAFDGWLFRRPAPTRVVLASGEPAEAPLVALIGELSEVGAEQPAMKVR